MNRESRRRTGVRAVLVAAAAAGLLAGCSGSGSSGGGSAKSSGVSSDSLSADPLTAVRSAADNTGHAGYVQDATTLTTTSSAKQMTLHGTASFDYSSGLGEMAVTIPPGDGSTGKLTEVVSPGVVYMQNTAAKVPAGKWMVVSVQQLADGNLVSSGATDPATAADALRGAQTATLAGSATVDGVVLKQYTGTLELAPAASATGGAPAVGLAQAARTFTVQKIPYQVWLDPQGRIHKIVEIFTFSRVPGSSAAKDQVVVVSTGEFSDFGTPVEVSIPPKADIYQPQPSGQ